MSGLKSLLGYQSLFFVHSNEDFIKKLSVVCFFWQIHDEARKFSYQTGVKVVVAYGGTPVNQQVSVTV